MKLESLKELLRYDEKTGVFIWLNPTKYHPRMSGKEAGCSATGYITIRIDGKKYKGHHLAWLYVTGSFPSRDIDHRDGNPLNNAFSNLRLCSNSQNQANKKRIANKRLPKGVRRNGMRFTARISFDKKTRTIGTFDSASEASDAYFIEAQRLYGVFARRDE